MGVIRWFGTTLNHIVNVVLWGGLGILGLRGVLVLFRTLLSDKSESLAFSVTGGNWPLLILLPAVFLGVYVWRAWRGIELLGHKFTCALLALVLLLAWSFFATAKPAAYGFLDAAVAVMTPLVLIWPILAGREGKEAKTPGDPTPVGEGDMPDSASTPGHYPDPGHHPDAAS